MCTCHNYSVCCVVVLFAGGALATLAALDLSINLQYVLRTVHKKIASQNGPHPVDDRVSKCEPVSLPVSTALLSPRLLVYTYGAPRVGNRAFTRWVGRQVPSMFRVEVDGDLVCRLPHVMYTCGECSVHVGLSSFHPAILIACY